MKHFRNLPVEPGGLGRPVCFMWSRREDLRPRCECWKRRPRWTVQRLFWRLYRCVDCEKLYWATVGVK